MGAEGRRERTPCPPPEASRLSGARKTTGETNSYMYPSRPVLRQLRNQHFKSRHLKNLAMAATLAGALSSGLLLPEVSPVPAAEAAGTDGPDSATVVSPVVNTGASELGRSQTAVRASRSLVRTPKPAPSPKRTSAPRKKAVKAISASPPRATATRRPTSQPKPTRASRSTRPTPTSSPRPTSTSSSGGGRGVPASVVALDWTDLADCESSGNPRAVNPAGPYLGLYQFDSSTWRSVGGSGSPTSASRSEQTYRAQLLYVQRGGSSAWPSCGRLLH